MKNRMKLLALALAVLMLAGAMAACNTNPGTTTTAGASSTTAAPGGTATTAAPTTGAAKTEPQILRYGLSGYDGAFMPIMYNVVYDSQFCSIFFEPLVTNNTGGEYVPILGTWEMENDNHTYVFTLKDGIKFNDGTPMTAADVEFTYKMIAHPEYNGTRSSAVSQLEGYQAVRDGTTTDFPGIEVRDDKTIAFHYTEGNASPANIKNFVYGIMNKAYYEADTWEGFIAKLSTPGEAGGSGPYILKEYKPKELIHCVKSLNYWDIANSEVFFDEILGIEVPIDNMIAALQTGQIDFGELGASMDNVAALDAIPGIRRYNDLANGYTYMTFNCRNGIFDDKRVRHAFLYALDRKSFIQVEYGELAQVGMTPLSPVSWAFPDVSEMNAYDYNPELAGQLLDEAGWAMGNDGFRYKDGRKLSVTWWVYHEATWPGTLSGMAADSWKQVGIELNIELMDFTTTSARSKDFTKEPREFDIYTMGFSLSAEPDPKGGLFDQDGYDIGGYDASGYVNQAAQDLIQAGRSTFDQAERAKIYKEWGLMMNEEVPTTIVAYRNFLWGISERIEGMDFNAMTNWSLHIHNTRFVD